MSPSWGRLELKLNMNQQKKGEKKEENNIGINNSDIVSWSGAPTPGADGPEMCAATPNARYARRARARKARSQRVTEKEG